MAALASKGETPQEIAGAWQAIMELDTTLVSKKLDAPVVENSGTGMDRLKTFNVSSAAAIVASSRRCTFGAPRRPCPYLNLWYRRFVGGHRR